LGAGQSPAKEGKQMEMTTLGKTGLQISRLGAGLAEIGELDDVSTATEVLNTALDGGINYLDTAACYGSSEAWIGRTIAHRRAEYILATKAGHVVGEHAGEDWAAETIRESIERSLVRMRTDYLDVVQLHSCEVEVLERGEVIQALQDARQAGMMRYVGYSGNGKAALWAIESGVFDVLQTTYNLVDQWARFDVLPRAVAAGIGVVAKRPIANAAWVPRPPHDATRVFYARQTQGVLGMGPLASAPADRIALFMGFALAHEAIDTAIVGTGNPAHMRANIALLETDLPLSAALVEELYRRFERLEELSH
jgi:aryl-alcohol dehydrogenase-like predicted oxidoreductase